MYPEGCLLSPDRKIFFSFVKDSMNPSNEGFIEFWSVSNDKSRTFVFRKRLARSKALSQWEKLICDGWEVLDEIELVA